MQIKDYITKNLPSLNWNILPQIFAENGVEMNEEIEAYLKETPENTNWSILEQLGGSESGIKWYNIYNSFIAYVQAGEYDYETSTYVTFDYAKCSISLGSFVPVLGEILKITIGESEKNINFNYTAHGILSNIDISNITDNNIFSSSKQEVIKSLLNMNPNGFYIIQGSYLYHLISLENAPTLEVGIPASVYCIDTDIPNTTLPKRLRYQWRGIFRSDFSSWEEAYNFCLEHATNNTEVANTLDISNDYVIVQDDSDVIWHYPGFKSTNNNDWFWEGTDTYYCYLTQDNLNIGCDD